VEGALLARTRDMERLVAENARLASDWKLREDGLTGSHEMRIEHLMCTLKEREQQNCDLHNQIHKSNVALESVRAELNTSRQEAEVCSPFLSFDGAKSASRILKCEVRLASSGQAYAVGYVLQRSLEATSIARAAQTRAAEELKEVQSLVQQRDQQIAAIKTENLKKSLHSEEEVEQAQAASASLRQQVESLLAQVCEQNKTISELQAGRDELEQKHAEQVRFASLYGHIADTCTAN
jgi:DNA repair exonuclease SbcCD ATPase subunit